MTEEIRTKIVTDLKRAAKAADVFCDVCEDKYTVSGVINPFYTWHNEEARKSLIVYGNIYELAEAVGAEVQTENTDRFYTQWFEAYGFIFVQTSQKGETTCPNS